MTESINSATDTVTGLQSDELYTRVERLKAQSEILSPLERERLAEMDMRTAKYQYFPDDTVNFVGVLAGVKPVALLHDLDLVTRYADDFSLHVSINHAPFEGATSPWIAVSRDEKVSQQLIENLSNLDDEESEREIGYMLGFPATAVDYYLKRIGTIDTPDELPFVTPLSTRGTASESFQKLIFSPDSYNDELNQYSVPLENAVKTLLPETYEVIEASYSRMKRRKKIAERAPFFLKKLLLKHNDDIKRKYVP